MDGAEHYVDWTNRGKKRTAQHITGENGVSILKDLLPGEWAVREYNPDYGIDLDVELFDDLGNKVYVTRGEHVLFQVKGTEKLNKKTIKHYIDYGRVYVMLQIYLKKMPRKHLCRPIFPKKLAVEPI